MWMTLETSFRPHVRGFFFHTSAPTEIQKMIEEFSSPCLGSLLSRGRKQHEPAGRSEGFRPHVWGVCFHLRKTSRLMTFVNGDFRPHVWGFFSQSLIRRIRWTRIGFSSPCLGSFLSSDGTGREVKECWLVFVPMYEDSFFTVPSRKDVEPWFEVGFRPHVWGFFLHRLRNYERKQHFPGFRPHVWGFFLHSGSQIKVTKKYPTCFRPHVWGFFFHFQQVWEAPPAGLSCALLRRGFPID